MINVSTDQRYVLGPLRACKSCFRVCAMLAMHFAFDLSNAEGFDGVGIGRHVFLLIQS